MKRIEKGPVTDQLKAEEVQALSPPSSSEYSVQSSLKYLKIIPESKASLVSTSSGSGKSTLAERTSQWTGPVQQDNSYDVINDYLSQLPQH